MSDRNLMRVRSGLLAFAVAALGTSAFAQNFNLDVGIDNPVPSNAYGAAASQPGVWQMIDAGLPATAFTLNDTSGAATSATVSYATAGNGLGNFFFNNAATTGDHENLLDDLQDVGGVGSTSDWSYSGLSNGAYIVYAYSWAPDNRTGFLTTVEIPGAVQGPQTISGTWTGNHVQGVTYAKFDFTVTAGTMLIKYTVPTGFGSVNGVQLVKSSCTGNVSNYCTSKVSSNNCVPVIAGAGTPSLATPGGFTVTSTNLEDNKNAITFYGTTGQNNVPFQGGFLCVKAPLYRLAVKNTGGAALCSGTISYTLQDHLNHASGGPLVVVGATIDNQTWFRDPGSPSTTGLSNGMEFVVCP